MWDRRHLTSLATFTHEDITDFLDHAESFSSVAAQEKARSRHRGKTFINLFFEASTRTRVSFELAGKRLGADVINVSSSGSSTSKGETLLDTAKNIAAMRAECIIVRHQASGAADFLVGRVPGAHIVNAGDGAHEHPTQALLDALTIRKHKGRLEGLVVAICGDIAHSRVARSNALLLGAMGSEVRFTCPGTMMPACAVDLGPTVRVMPRLEQAIEGADVVMMLRIQTERLSGAMFPTTREYARTFGLGARAFARMKPEAIVMHPGPINRGVELDPTIADGSRSVILDQVEAGICVRMAALDRVMSVKA